MLLLILFQIRIMYIEDFYNGCQSRMILAMATVDVLAALPRSQPCKCEKCCGFMGHFPTKISPSGFHTKLGSPVQEL